MRRWLALAEVDDGTRPGLTGEESDEVNRLKGEVRRPPGGRRELPSVLSFPRAGVRPPEPLILGLMMR